MKQLLQRLDNGATTLVELPIPTVSGVQLLVQTRATVISAGTERTLLEFGRASLLAKARSQPERVRQVLNKAAVDGVGPTLDAVRSKLATPIPLGYCHAGVVAETGDRAKARFAPGDRVVTNGPHAEYVRVPMTLAARIPDGVPFEEAAFTPLAAIGLQGVRLAQPTLGETVVVVGLGMIGLLTVQLLRANGCHVIGIDPSMQRRSLAARFGADAVSPADRDPVAAVLALTDGVGADAVLLTLASDSDEPARQAAEMSRKRGRIVLIGVTGLNFDRDPFFRKELSFSVSCSYGPGRYDASYEESGVDYPIGYVRWTEQRNFEAVLALMADRKLDVGALITHRFAFASAPSAYDVLVGAEPSLGVVLEYPEDGAPGAAPAPAQRTLVANPRRATADASLPAVAVIGAGNFAMRTLLPSIARTGARLHTIVASSGAGTATAAGKFGFENVSSDVDAVLSNPEISTVFVLTRHDSHASLARRALDAGKHVFVEKPLALNESDLDEIAASASRSGRLLLVGFNRRFAPLTAKLQGELAARSGPLTTLVTVNAGAIPREHWTQDAERGGGRIVGEACHFIDLTRAITGASITGLHVVTAHRRDGMPIDDVASLSLEFADGSTASIQYLANGASTFPKERVECFADGRIFRIDNWRRLEEFGSGAPWFAMRHRMDKGHDAEVAVWMRAVSAGGVSPIPLEEQLEVSRWSIRAGDLARRGGA